MIIPYGTRRASGLRRLGRTIWNAKNGDPHFRFGFRLWRPRHLVVVIEGIDQLLEPCLYLDTGDGFHEHKRLNLRPAGRLAIHLDLARLSDVREVRLDPFEERGCVRLYALATPFGSVARWLLKLATRRSVACGPTHSFTLRTSHPDQHDIASGLQPRRYRNCAEHYAHVVAQQHRDAPPASDRTDLLISFVVPTYNTKPEYLDALLASFLPQSERAELVFSDDGSHAQETLDWLRTKSALPQVRVVFNAANQGIAAATNAALSVCTAPWIGLVDHDDALAPGAVAQIALAFERHPDAVFLYTDEIIADAELEPKDYFLKPAYDPVLLSGVNYINHLSLYRRERLQAIGGFREGFNGSQDHDLLLRYLDGVADAHVLHLPYPAYIWRRHESSFSTEFEDRAVASARRALKSRYDRADETVTIAPALMPSLHRVVFPPPRDGWPKVSVVIPNRNARALMESVLGGLERTDYPALDIVVVDNDSDDPAVFALYRACRDRGIELTVVPAAGAFNFSRSVNAGMARARGDLILLLNNDIEILAPDWLKEMVSCFRYPDTGIVGARLLYPDRTLQHAGVIVGLGDLAGHWFCGSRETTRGPMGRLAVRQSLSAVTGAAMMISRACLERVGPFDEDRFAVAYNDIDFCLRARANGFRVVWTPFATLLHHESKSRGSDEHPERIERFRREQQNLRARHATDRFDDPAFNPWYTRDRAVPGLRALDRLPEARTAVTTGTATETADGEPSPMAAIRDAATA